MEAKPERGFKFLTGDVCFTDHGGKWVRKVGYGRYHVIELTNWEDACGRDAEGGPTYNLDLSEINIGDSERAREALESCGWAILQEGLEAGSVYCPHSGDIVATGESVSLCIVEAMHSAGSKAPLDSADGNNWRQLFREMVRASKALDEPAAHAAAMARPVNRIGSTAAEYAAGDVRSAVLRGLADGDPKAELLAKIGGLR